MTEINARLYVIYEIEQFRISMEITQPAYSNCVTDHVIISEFSLVDKCVSSQWIEMTKNTN